MQQFPLSFEFNDYYLRFLAYHSVSCRFTTFLCDCEYERLEAGFDLTEPKKRDVHKIYDDGESTANRVSSPVNNGQLQGQNIFDYIDSKHKTSALFYNFLYAPDFDSSSSVSIRIVQ